MDLQLIVVICFELLFILYAVFNALLICIYLDKSTSNEMAAYYNVQNQTTSYNKY